MTQARDRILAAVRDGLLKAELPDARHERPAPLPTGEVDTPELLAVKFETALVALTGEVHRARSSAELADVIHGIASANGATSYLAWDENTIGCPGLFDELTSRGLRHVAYDLPFDAGKREASVRALADVGLGLTGADAALADSGAIVLASGIGRGRLASLLPPVHIAVVRTSTLSPSLPALLAARPDLADRGSNMVVIAGPSRTADIEMVLTHGVHGPKRVHAILIP